MSIHFQPGVHWARHAARSQVVCWRLNHQDHTSFGTRTLATREYQRMLKIHCGLKYLHIGTHAWLIDYTYVYIHRYIYIYIHSCIDTYTYMYTQIHKSICIDIGRYASYVNWGSLHWSCDSKWKVIGRVAGVFPQKAIAAAGRVGDGL